MTYINEVPPLTVAATSVVLDYRRGGGGSHKRELRRGFSLLCPEVTAFRLKKERGIFVFPRHLSFSCCQNRDYVCVCVCGKFIHVMNDG